MFALPLNPITENFYYIDESDTLNQRVIISAPTVHPLVWQISKVANTNPFGIQIVTGYQDKWNPETDFVDTEEQEAGDPFAMYANYYRYTVTPVEPENHSSIYLDLTSNNNQIKAGGSYKLVTAKLCTESGEDLADEITDATWTCYLNDEDITDDESLITWLAQDNINQMKIKFANVRQYYTKILTVKCAAAYKEKEIAGEMQFQISAL